MSVCVHVAVWLMCTTAGFFSPHDRALRSLIFHGDEAMHLKLTGVLYDQCQETLVLFTEFLERHLGGTARHRPPGCFPCRPHTLHAAGA